MKSVVFTTPDEVMTWRQAKTGKSVGFVPTMGALHAGHERLLTQARSENDLVVLSIFVNPTQFNNKEDFKNYPTTWEHDVALAEKHGVDAIFYPKYEAMYPTGYNYKVNENEFSHMLCGKSRPGHFDGVLTVVMKLLNIVQPQKAYFGEKDFQQLKLIEGMATAFFMSCQIVPVATVRENDGLALSSRNVRLTPEQRKIAPQIHQTLTTAESPKQARQQLEKQGLQVDYVEDFGGRRFAAAQLGEVRLIDNVKI